MDTECRALLQDPHQPRASTVFLVLSSLKTCESIPSKYMTSNCQIVLEAATRDLGRGEGEELKKLYCMCGTYYIIWIITKVFAKTEHLFQLNLRYADYKKKVLIDCSKKQLSLMMSRGNRTMPLKKRSNKAVLED